MGFLQSSANADERESHDKIQKALKDTFRPEFLNRIDEIITFSSLSKEQMQQIVDLQMEEIQERLCDHDLSVELTEASRAWLANEGYDPAFGARPLQRALQKHVESPLSISLLSGEFKSGDKVIVDVDEETDQLVFRPLSEPIPAENIQTVDSQN